MRIDAHQHFWKFDTSRDAWITSEMQVIKRDFLPDDLAPLLSQNRINGCIAVQADQSEMETDFLIELAAKNSFIKGIVGWVDLTGSNLISRLKHYSTYASVKGFRHIVQSEPNGFLLRADFIKGVQQLRSFNFTYDLLIYPHQLNEAVQFASELRDQPIVIDHLAKPYIRKQEIAEWRKSMTQLSAFENIYCKVSGLVTEADWKQWAPVDFQPYLETALDLFGPNRLMFGSDWPVCLLAGNYSQIIQLIEGFISTLSSEEKTKIMGENAVRFYNL